MPFSSEYAMARKTKIEAERMRLHILRTSLDLFQMKGYERTTIENVAERIGLTKGAVYWYFKHKPDLLTALVAYMSERHEEAMKGLPKIRSLAGLRDNFIKRADLVMTDTESFKFMQVVTRMDWSVPELKELKAQVLCQERGLLHELTHELGKLKEAGLLKKEVEPRLTAMVLSALWMGLVKAKLDYGAEVDLPRAIRMGFDMAIATIAEDGNRKTISGE